MAAFSGAVSVRGLLHDPHQRCSRRWHGAGRFGSGSFIELPNNCVFIVIVHSQDDIVGHGGLLFLGRKARTPEHQKVFFRRVYLDLRGETANLFLMPSSGVPTAGTSDLSHWDKRDD
jgi:hypothetical protein